MHLIIDLDSMIYKAGFSAETKTRRLYIKGEEDYRASFRYVKDLKAWMVEHDLTDDDVEVTTSVDIAPLSHAKHLLDLMLASIHGNYPDATSSIMFMGGVPDYRFLIYPDYKANRRDIPKPHHYKPLFNSLRLTGAVVPTGVEADDAVCTDAWRCINSGEDFVIAGIDKDLAQIPGRHYNYDSQEEILIDPISADLNFYTQLLMGDVADNIPGIHRVGPVKAARLLEDCDDERDMYNVCLEEWSKNEGEAAMHVSANMLYLLRDEYDQWTPPCGT